MRFVTISAMLLAATALSIGCNQNKKVEMAPTGAPVQTVSDETTIKEPLPPPPTVTPPPSTTPPVAGKGAKTYTVQEGDKGFFAISRRVYGSNAKAKAIAAANPGIDPTKLKVGQVINLPE